MSTRWQDDAEFRLALMATQPPQERGAAAAASGFSAVVNFGLVAALIWVTANATERRRPEAETVAFIRLETEPPPPIPPAPPIMTAAAPVTEIVQADVPLGFQTLAPPTVVPPDIPAPSAGAIVNEADFSGVGVEGGRATGMAARRVVTSEDVSAAPAFTPHTVAPELTNRADVGKALVSLYPKLLRDAGVGGTVLVWFFIDVEGRVQRSQVKESSGHETLDAAALQVADMMEFTPAWNRDRKVPVWIAMPIEFSAR